MEQNQPNEYINRAGDHNLSTDELAKKDYSQQWQQLSNVPKSYKIIQPEWNKENERTNLNGDNFSAIDIDFAIQEYKSRGNFKHVNINPRQIGPETIIRVGHSFVDPSYIGQKLFFTGTDGIRRECTIVSCDSPTSITVDTVEEKKTPLWRRVMTYIWGKLVKFAEWVKP